MRKHILTVVAVVAGVVVVGVVAVCAALLLETFDLNDPASKVVRSELRELRERKVQALYLCEKCGQPRNRTTADGIDSWKCISCDDEVKQPTELTESDASWKAFNPFRVVATP